MNMMKHSARVVMLMAGLAVGATACGPDVPANPDWATDVRPILQARCVRCHSNPARIDPAAKDQVGALPFDTDAATPLSTVLTNMMPARVRGGQGALPIMPPPPNASLEDWQIQILTNYAKNHP